MSQLSIVDWLFVAQYAAHGNASRAYRESHPDYKGVRHGELGWQTLKRADIKRAISDATKASKEAASITKEMVRTDIVNVLSADPRELFNVQDGACRFCHGVGHQYQRTIGEMNRDRHQAEMKDELFDMKGGIGYDAYADPHPLCPECNGQGEQRIKLTDTRLLSPETASLLASIEQTKHGVKITTRSKDAAREAAARLLGMNKDTVDVNHTVKLEDMSNEELAAMVARELGK